MAFTAPVCTKLKLRGDSLYRTVSQSDEKCVIYGQAFLSAITKAQWPLYQSTQNSQLADGILWMSTVPNFAQSFKKYGECEQKLIALRP